MAGKKLPAITRTSQSNTAERWFDNGVINDLITVRDWLRFAVSEFEAACLSYGHGTGTALDEAAFLILHTLNLDISELEPWLDARLTRSEREKVAVQLARRIDTRKPAAYLTGCAYIQGHRFHTDERVIVPRSYIGELFAIGLDTIVPDRGGVERVLDMCTGSGCLAILAALYFPNATVDGADLSDDALAVAQKNVDDYGLGERIQVIKSDLFSAIGEKRYDVIIANPPYVRDDEIKQFPPEYDAEPVMAHAGGPDGLDLVRKILAQAARHLRKDGVLIVEAGRALDALEAEYPGLPFMWLDTEESQGEVFALTYGDLKGL